MSANPSPKSSSSQVQLPTDQELVLKVIPMPGDCNANGDIFGGWVMAQVDLAGSVVPARYAGGRMATVAVNEASVDLKIHNTQAWNESKVQQLLRG
jgi:acyl-CoA thioesterase YciA